MATTNLISRSADREAAARSVLRLSFTLALFCGTGLLLYNVLCAPAVLRALGASPEVAAEAMRYIGARRCFVPFVFVSSCSTAAFLSLRDPLTPLRWVAASAVVNVAGDYALCVAPLRLGIAGAAWATVASQCTLLGGLLFGLRARGALPSLLPPPPLASLLPFLTFAGPVSVLTALRVAGFGILASFANSLGPAALAAHQVSVSLFVLLSICGEPLNSAGQTTLPRLYPGGAEPDARRAARLVGTLVRAALAVGLASSAAGAGLLLLGGKLLAADGAVFAELARCVRLYCACLLLTSTTVVLDGALVAKRDWRVLGWGG